MFWFSRAHATNLGATFFTIPLFCRHRGTVFTSAGNHAALTFKSDNSVTTSGFRVTVRSVCGGSTTATNGVVTSPGYPGNYPPGANCVWLVKGCTLGSCLLRPAG